MGSVSGAAVVSAVDISLAQNTNLRSADYTDYADYCLRLTVNHWLETLKLAERFPLVTDVMRPQDEIRAICVICGSFLRLAGFPGSFASIRGSVFLRVLGVSVVKFMFPG